MYRHITVPLSTLCCLLIALSRVQGQMLGSGSGSGSGSGLLQPMFVGCPVSTLNETLNATVGTSQLNSTMGWPTAPGSTVSASVTYQVLPLAFLGSIVVQTSLSPSGDSLLITVEDQYGELSSSNTIRLYVSLVATSVQMVDSQPCNFTIEIAIQDPPVCNTIQSSVMVIEPPATIQPLYSVRIIVDIPISNFTANMQLLLLQIRNVTANVMTSSCAANCPMCSMEGSCSVFLQVCSGFSEDDVVIANVQPQTSGTGGLFARNIVTGSGTVVTFFVRLPNGAPSTTPIPFVSASTVQQVSAESVSVYEAVLQAAIIGTPEVLVPGIRVPTTPEGIAVIVVPILVILAVFSLVIGIVIILVIVYLKKGKKTAKVLPTVVSHPADLGNNK